MSKEQIQELKQQIKRYEKHIIQQTLANTSYLLTSTILPDAVASVIADNFTLKEDATGQISVAPEDKNGVPIAFSTERIGEPANLEEACQALVERDYSRYLMPEPAKQDQQPSSNDNRHPLRRQYDAAVEAGDVEARIAIKSQMVEQGIKAPL